MTLSIKQKIFTASLLIILIAFFIFECVYFSHDYESSENKYKYITAKRNVSGYTNVAYTHCHFLPDCDASFSTTCFVNSSCIYDSTTQNDTCYSLCATNSESLPCINGSSFCHNEYENYCHCHYYNQWCNESCNITAQDVSICAQVCPTMYYNNSQPCIFSSEYAEFEYDSKSFTASVIILILFFLAVVGVLCIMIVANKRREQQANLMNEMVDVEIDKN